MNRTYFQIGVTVLLGSMSVFGCAKDTQRVNDPSRTNGPTGTGLPSGGSADLPINGTGTPPPDPNMNGPEKRTPPPEKSTPIESTPTK